MSEAAVQEIVAKMDAYWEIDDGGSILSPGARAALARMTERTLVNINRRVNMLARDLVRKNPNLPPPMLHNAIIRFLSMIYPDFRHYTISIAPYALAGQHVDFVEVKAL